MNRPHPHLTLVHSAEPKPLQFIERPYDPLDNADLSTSDKVRVALASGERGWRAGFGFGIFVVIFALAIFA